MAKAKRDRKPARSNSKAMPPTRVIPAGWGKCSQCGRTVPVETLQPDVPAVWQACKPCWAKSKDVGNKLKNPGEVDY